MKRLQTINFPRFSGVRCLMMPYVQGDPESVPMEFRKGYEEILSTVMFEEGDRGYLTIDESFVLQDTPHRGDRAAFGRALHTEAGLHPDSRLSWGAPTWGGKDQVTLDRDVEVLLANSVSGSCALWDAVHENTSLDGDIGDCAEQYPYVDGTFMKAGDVYQIGILTPHESIPVVENVERQFLRIISSGVHGREDHFTRNPLIN